MHSISVKYILLLSFILSSVWAFSANETPFVLVIDAGHGGKDAGAVGAISHEKTINLAVTLAFGKMVKESHPDVKVVYTRDTDKYLTLAERAVLSNKAKANLFVSIHTNSVDGNSSAFGTETYTLGLAKTKDNLNVAMRENAVILLEEDYKQKYEGFDPKSVDSYIMFEFVQDKSISNSLQLASDIQTNFETRERKNRGVRQAGFVVLHAVAAPSVLVELGFISNKAEEKYLNTTDGQQQLAEAIYEAFVKYKRDYDRKSGGSNLVADSVKQTEIVKKEEKKDSVKQEKSDKDAPVYQLQLFAVAKKLSKNNPAFKGLKTSYFEENNLYKYTYGNTTSLEEIKQLKQEIASKFPDAMIISFVKGKKTPVK